MIVVPTHQPQQKQQKRIIIRQQQSRCFRSWEGAENERRDITKYIVSIPIGKLSRSDAKMAMTKIHWHLQKSQKGPAPALNILERLLKEEEHNNDICHQSLKQGVIFNIFRACQRWNNNHYDTKLLQRIFCLLQRNRRLYDHKWPSFIISLLVKNTNNSNYDTNNAIEYATDILREMEKIPEHQPNQQDYGAVLNALAKSSYNKRNAAKKATDIVEWMEQSECSNTQPNIVIYTSLLKCYANDGMGYEAENLLKKMHGLYTVGKLTERPNVISYSVVVEAYSKSKEEDAPHIAEGIVNQMQETGPRPNLITFRNLLMCFANRGMITDTVDLLKKMHELKHNTSLLREGPDTKMYNSVINAISKSGDPDSAMRVDAVFSLMQEMNRSGHDHVAPDMYTYSGLLRCYASNKNSSLSLEAAGNLLEQMHQDYNNGCINFGPNTVMYNIFLNMLAKSKESDASDRARSVIDRMEQMHKNGYTNLKPDIISFASLLDCLANSTRPHKANEAEDLLYHMENSGELATPPSKIAYGCVMSDQAGFATRAESLLNRMLDLYLNKGRRDLIPDAHIFSSVLKCFVNENLYEDAERILQHMNYLYDNGTIEQGPNKVSYCIIIDALAQSCDKGAPQRATSLLNQLEKVYKSTGRRRKDLQPDVRMFTSILNLYANHGMSIDAEKLLERMNMLYDNDDLVEPPNTVSYNCVLKSLHVSIKEANADVDKLLERAKCLLQRMQEKHITSDKFTKTSFLLCYSKANQLEIGEQLYYQITKGE